MKARRLYRQWDRTDCPISIRRFTNKRVMEFFSPHLHDEIELFYIRRGIFEIYRTEGNCRVETGTVYVVPPNEVHSIRSLCDDGEYMGLSFDTSAIAMGREHFFQRKFVEPLQSGKLHLPRLLKISDPVNKTLFEYFERLFCLDIEASDDVSKRFLYTMGICTDLMNCCTFGDEEGIAEQADSDLVKECVKYMHDHYKEKLSLSVLAEHVHVHPNYLCAAFKKDVGVTVLEYLSRIRVEQARELLGRRNPNISQVAEQCGFRSISTFQRSFKAITGITPSGYAKNFKSSDTLR